MLGECGLMNINDAKILICDDSQLVRKQLRDIVEAAGKPAIFEANDGEEAMECIKFEQPNVLLIDLCMPNMDGMAVIRQILRMNPKPYTIVVSSLGTKESIMQAITYGAKDFIQKPFTAEQIINALEKALKSIKE